MSAHTPAPWEACQEGKCKCGQIWSKPADHPVAQVTIGKWGDDYPALRFTEDSTSLHHLVEPYMEQITYGEVAAEIAEANARRIVACVNYCEGVSTAEIEAAPANLRLRDLLQFIDSQAKPPLEVTEEHREQDATDLQRAYPERRP